MQVLLLDATNTMPKLQDASVHKCESIVLEEKEQIAELLTFASVASLSELVGKAAVSTLKH